MASAPPTRRPNIIATLTGAPVSPAGNFQPLLYATDRARTSRDPDSSDILFEIKGAEKLIEAFNASQGRRKP